MFGPGRNNVPQFRPRPPGHQLPGPPGPPPGMMSMNQPFQQYPMMHGRPPLHPPPFPGGQQQHQQQQQQQHHHPGFGPPPGMVSNTNHAILPGPPPGHMPSGMPPGQVLPAPPMRALPSVPYPAPPPALIPFMVPPPPLPRGPPLPGGLTGSTPVPPPSFTTFPQNPLGDAPVLPLPPPPPPPPPPSSPPPSPPPPPPGSPTQTSPVGVDPILPQLLPQISSSLPAPPPKPSDEELVHNIEILSQFVVKNGLEFENMARAKEAGNPKFSFLFGGETGSDAWIGFEYFKWAKMKFELELKVQQQPEVKQLSEISVPPHLTQQLAETSFPLEPTQKFADTLLPPEATQQFAQLAIASEGVAKSPKSPAGSDTDMEDDFISLGPSNKDRKDARTYQTREANNELKGGKGSEQHAFVCLSSSLIPTDTSIKESMPVIGNQLGELKLENQESKGLHRASEFENPNQSWPKELQNTPDATLPEHSIPTHKHLYKMSDGPCIQDLSPVRHFPNEFQQASEETCIKDMNPIQSLPNEFQQRSEGLCVEDVSPARSSPGELEPTSRGLLVEDLSPVHSSLQRLQQMYDGPCIEDLSPVRFSPKELHDTSEGPCVEDLSPVQSSQKELSQMSEGLSVEYASPAQSLADELQQTSNTNIDKEGHTPSASREEPSAELNAEQERNSSMEEQFEVITGKEGDSSMKESFDANAEQGRDFSMKEPFDVIAEQERDFSMKESTEVLSEQERDFPMKESFEWIAEQERNSFMKESFEVSAEQERVSSMEDSFEVIAEQEKDSSVKDPFEVIPMVSICESKGPASEHNEQIENSEVADKSRGINSVAISDMEANEIEAIKCVAGESSKGLYESVPQENINIREVDDAKPDTEMLMVHEQKPLNVDEFGRLIREGGSDSESDGILYTGRAGPRSPSRGDRRKRSPSPRRRRGRRSRSRSWSPRRKRSRSRTPPADFRRGGETEGRKRRGSVPECHFFKRGGCFRGASCRFLHLEVPVENISKWSGGERSREQKELMQDTQSSHTVKEVSAEVEENKPKGMSPDRLCNGQDSLILKEKLREQGKQLDEGSVREKGMLGWTANDDSHLPELDANLDSQPPQNANLDSLLHLMPSQSPPQNRADSQSESLPVEESQSQASKMEEMPQHPLPTEDFQSFPPPTEDSRSQPLPVQDFSSQPLQMDDVRSQSLQPLETEEIPPHPLQTEDFGSLPPPTEDIRSQPLHVDDFSSQSLQIEDFRLQPLQPSKIEESSPPPLLTEDFCSLPPPTEGFRSQAPHVEDFGLQPPHVEDFKSSQPPHVEEFRSQPLQPSNVEELPPHDLPTEAFSSLPPPTEGFRSQPPDVEDFRSQPPHVEDFRSQPPPVEDIRLQPPHVEDFRAQPLQPLKMEEISPQPLPTKDICLPPPPPLMEGFTQPQRLEEFRSQPLEDFRSQMFPKPPPMEDFRGLPLPNTSSMEDFRSLPPPVEDFRSRPPPVEDFRSRPPPVEDFRSRPPPVEDFRSPPPLVEDFRSRPPPVEDFRPRFLPGEDFRSRPPPMEDFHSRPPPMEDFRSRPLPMEDFQHRPQPGEDFRHRTLSGEDFQHRTLPGEDFRHHNLPGEDFRHRPMPMEGFPSKSIPIEGFLSRSIPMDGFSARPPPMEGFSSRPPPMEGFSARPPLVEGFAARPPPMERFSARPPPMESFSARPLPIEGFSARPSPMESFQPRPFSVGAFQSQSHIREDAHRENFQGHLLPRQDFRSPPLVRDDLRQQITFREGLHAEPILRRDFRGQPLFRDDSRAPSHLREELHTRILREDSLSRSHSQMQVDGYTSNSFLKDGLRSQHLPREDLRFRADDLQSRENFLSKPYSRGDLHFPSGPRDLSSLQQHDLGRHPSSTHPAIPGNLSLLTRNALQSSPPLSHLNLTNTDHSRPGYFGGYPPSSHNSSFALNQNPESQPGFISNSSTRESDFNARATDFSHHLSDRPETSLDPYNLLQFSGNGQGSHISRPVTKPPLSPRNISRPGIPPFVNSLSSNPSSMAGEWQSYPYSRPGGSSMAGMAVHQPVREGSAPGDQYDPLYDSIEPVTTGPNESLRRLLESIKAKENNANIVVESNMAPQLENDSPHKAGKMRIGSVSRPLDVEENNKHKDGATSAFKEIEAENGAVAAMDAEGGAVENGSPGLEEGKNWSPDQPLEAAVGGVGEIEIDQVKGTSKSKKSKDSRSMKLFRSALAEFVKEALKPSWREGHMSKEAFKTIVKKAVDKVAGAMQSHQIPKTRGRIDQYVASSERKLTKLVQGYVDKYVRV